MVSHWLQCWQVMYRSTLSLASVLAGHMTHFRSSLDDQTNWLVHKYYIKSFEFLNHLKKKKNFISLTHIIYLPIAHAVYVW
uniref:Secreted protein n=1 Tax=Octopus bimaculoides TaxID=37653 RepID=A0A0L8HUV3_OCTBM